MTEYRVWDVQYKFHGKVTVMLFFNDRIEVDYEGNTGEPRTVRDEEVILERLLFIDAKKQKVFENDIVLCLSQLGIASWNEQLSMGVINFPQSEVKLGLNDLYKYKIIKKGNTHESEKLVKFLIK